MATGRYPQGGRDIPPARLESYDVVVLGAGSAAEELCSALTESDDERDHALRVAVVERERVGGECPFLACMPSKAMLRSASLRRLLSHAHELGSTPDTVPLVSAESAYAAAARRRDTVAEERDDAAHVEELAATGVDLFRGDGRVLEPGIVEVRREDEVVATLSYRSLVLATGSTAVVPPIPGLSAVSPWTSDEALTSPERPESILVLGGGPVGCELAEMYSSFGVTVLLVESGDRLLEREEPGISERLEAHLCRIGVDVRCGVTLLEVTRLGTGVLALLSDGTSVSVDRVLAAAGRRPRSDGLGLDVLGVETDEQTGAVRVDEGCRVHGLENTYAIGDINGLAPFTHAAKAQARVVASRLRGGAARHEPDLVPRCVYTEPPVAAVGLTAEAARARGRRVVTAAMDLGETARAESDGRRLDGSLDEGTCGLLVLVGDPSRETLLGAGAIGPRSEEWIGEAALAIAAEVPLRVLAGLIHPFPSYSESLDPAYRELLRKCRR